MSCDSICNRFSCLGNICRSPMAEAVFAHTVNQKQLRDRFGVIDSAGTAGYHVCSPTTLERTFTTIYELLFSETKNNRLARHLTTDQHRPAANTVCLFLTTLAKCTNPTLSTLTIFFAWMNQISRICEKWHRLEPKLPSSSLVSLTRRAIVSSATLTTVVSMVSSVTSSKSLEQVKAFCNRLE